MSFDVSYRYCPGSTPPCTEVVLDGAEATNADDITISPCDDSDRTWFAFNKGGNAVAYFELEPGELLTLIGELQRAYQGCFIGEWPRPIIPKPDPELERLLAEEEEIERRTREHHVHVSNSFHYGGTVGGAPPRTADDEAPHLTVQGRPTVRKLREFLEGFDDEQSLAIDVRVVDDDDTAPVSASQTKGPLGFGKMDEIARASSVYVTFIESDGSARVEMVKHRS